MGVPGPSIEQYAEEKAAEKAKKVPDLFPTTEPKKEELEKAGDTNVTVEPSKTVEGKVDVVEDDKVVGSQG